MTLLPWRCSQSISSSEAAQQSDLWSATGSPGARRRRGSKNVGRMLAWSPGTRSDPSGPGPGACCTP